MCNSHESWNANVSWFPLSFPGKQSAFCFRVTRFDLPFVGVLPLWLPKNSANHHLGLWPMVNSISRCFLPWSRHVFWSLQTSTPHCAGKCNFFCWSASRIEASSFIKYVFGIKMKGTTFTSKLVFLHSYFLCMESQSCSPLQFSSPGMALPAAAPGTLLTFVSKRSHFWVLFFFPSCTTPNMIWVDD